MKRLAFLVGAAAVTCMSTVASADVGGVPWFDDMDSYTCGDPATSNGWEGWDGDVGSAGIVACDVFRSAPNSMQVSGFQDGVQVHQGFSSGKWVYTTYQYIPTGTTGTTYFIMMSQYMDYADKVWAVQVYMDNRFVHDDYYGSGADLDVILGEWVEIRVEIDTCAGTHDFYYGGNALYTGQPWNGPDNIGGTDLWSNGASAVYYDDFSIVPAPMEGACCIDGVCVPYDFRDACEAAGGTFYPCESCALFECPVTPAFGSCCNNFSGLCVDDIQGEYCTGPWDRFTEGVACIDLVIPCGDPLAWACCVGLGGGIIECADNATLTDCEAIGGSWFEDELCFGEFVCPAPCPLDDPGGSVDELEACGVSSNAGCAVGTAEDLTCGVPVHGFIYSLNDAGVRDSDWYVIDTTGMGWTQMTWTVQSQHNYTLSGMLEYNPGWEGSGVCDFATALSGYISPAVFADACETVSTSVIMPEGIYWWYLRPGNYSSVNCNTYNEYYATLTCEPVVVGACCADDATCSMDTEANCTAGGGSFYAGEDCATFECPADCPYDLNGSGVVDFGDLLIILDPDVWGSSGHPADLNGNGVVDFGDLLVILDPNVWGSSC